MRASSGSSVSVDAPSSLSLRAETINRPSNEPIALLNSQDGTFQCGAKRPQIARDVADPLVDLLPLAANLPRILFDLLLLPSVRDGFQKRDQGRRGGDDDLFA